MPLLYHVISFSYNAALLAEEDAKSPKSDFFPDWNLRFEKAGKSKQSSFTHKLASSLMYAPMEGNTGIAIFMPTSKCSLPVAGSRFLPAFDHSSSIVKWSLKVRHSLTRLGITHLFLEVEGPFFLKPISTFYHVGLNWDAFCQHLKPKAKFIEN